jgi:hypothetical protein
MEYRRGRIASAGSTSGMGQVLSIGWSPQGPVHVQTGGRANTHRIIATVLRQPLCMESGAYRSVKRSAVAIAVTKAL